MATDRREKVKQLFEAALVLHAEQREAVLGALDPSLREEVESLLVAHGEDSLIEKTPPGVGSVTAEKSTAIRPPSSDSHNADRIGPYKILREIGEGGMGVVYEAEQGKPVRRKVALKLIKWGMDSKAVIARFESERQALALMNHPNIASVYDAGATEQGRPYFAMELVRGEPITEYCDKNRLTIKERLGLFIQVCGGVQHAHQKGIIHRDIKPSNILITIQDDKPVPKIIDFGVAKATSQRLTEKTVYTELGQLIGTPEYMSPEQAEMTGIDIDTRTDVYSLGVVLYELLVGAQPFDAKTLRQASFDDMRRKIREEAPPKPSTRLTRLGEPSTTAAKNRRVELRSLERELSGDLDWITMKTLEKDRTRRYGSPSELAADIGRHLRNEPALASPPSTSYRVRKFARRHRVVVTAAAVVFVALLLGIIGTVLGLVEATRQRDAARTAQEMAERETAKATAINEFLQETLGSANPREGLGRDATVLEALGSAVEKVDETFSEQPEVEAAVRYTIGRTYMELGQLEEAERQLERALVLHENIFGREHEQVAESLNSLGELALVRVDDATAEHFFTEALAMRRRLLGEEHLLVAELLHNLGLAHFQRGDYEEAARLTRESLAMQRKVGTVHSATLTGLALFEHYGGNYDAAEAIYREVLEADRKRLGDRHTDFGLGLQNLAFVLHDKGDDHGAELLLREAVAIQREQLGESHRGVAVPMTHLGMSLVMQGNDEDGARWYSDAIAIEPGLITEGGPQRAETRGVYGMLM